MTSVSNLSVGCRHLDREVGAQFASAIVYFGSVSSLDIVRLNIQVFDIQHPIFITVVMD